MSIIVSNCHHCKTTISITVMCTLHDILSNKIRFIHTSTVTGSQYCSGKTTRMPRVHLVYIVPKQLFYINASWTKRQRVPTLNCSVKE